MSHKGNCSRSMFKDKSLQSTVLRVSGTPLRILHTPLVFLLWSMYQNSHWCSHHMIWQFRQQPDQIKKETKVRTSRLSLFPKLSIKLTEQEKTGLLKISLIVCESFDCKMNIKINRLKNAFKKIKKKKSFLFRAFSFWVTSYEVSSLTSSRT